MLPAKNIKSKRSVRLLTRVGKKRQFQQFFVSFALFNKNERGEESISVEDRINGTEFCDIISHLVSTVMAFGNVEAIR